MFIARPRALDRVTRAPHFHQALNTPAIYTWQRVEKDPLSTFLESLRAREEDLRTEAQKGG